MKVQFIAMPVLLAVAACDSGTSDDAAAPATEPAETTPLAIAAPAPTGIPAAIQGRWGLAAADCEPGRGDATGVLTIDASTLRFYESVGTLDEIEQASESSIRADFDFTGEGMTWEREMQLDLEQNGTVLVRREFGDDALPEPLRYTKCG